MMNCEYSSKLTFNDLRDFLGTCFFDGCKLDERFYMEMNNDKTKWKKKLKFVYENNNYVFFFNDINVDIYEVRERKWKLGIEHTRLINDNWKVFLYNKFGVAYLDKYKKYFESQGHVFGTPSFVSKISMNDISEYMIRVSKYEGYKVEIIELTSIFKAERRFLLRIRDTCCFRYFRISDFDAITMHGCTTQFFLRFMVRQFGEEYLNAYEKYLKERIETVNLTQRREKEYERLDKKIIELEEASCGKYWYSMIG